MIRAIVTDIEGTTSSLSFVKDVLFPYARAHIAQFVREHRDEPAVAALLEEARAEAGNPGDDEALIATLIDWIDADRKIGPLKALQGMIWERGYRDGDFTGHVYPDAQEYLRRWHQQGIRLYVYSSGSVQAQKLLFGYTEYGDMTPLFSGYYDTRTGAKRDPAAYRAIRKTIGIDAGEILFLSDIREELDAARAAGMATCWLVRDGRIDTEAAHPQARDFSQISI